MAVYQLGKASEERLQGVHPHLVAVVRKAITLTRQDFTVHEGVRSLATQRDYVARGASQTLASRHLVGPDGYGHAVDLCAWAGGMIRWEWALYLPIADAMRRAARELGIPLRYGGGWYRLEDCDSEAAIARATAAYVRERKAAKKAAFLDGPHFELPQGKTYP